ncbi:MBL fold metallo-hydrolase [Ramlibacter sp. 2FC]|uniref:MBL fold metallo-hydrolase n=1 Tax=Ramlibacter sp. 2FC TaxID=2502188 RepID=UPI0010FA1E65|nr:MBL fold metallo-hydrolase [Ramlibacter sp. 2FC]
MSALRETGHQAGDAVLPAGVTVFERGWLSSNSILLVEARTCALVDSGYVTHAPQTLSLVQQALGPRPLDLLLNTHLHSDHCGGNAALQQAYPGLRTHIPPGLAPQVAQWDDEALSYTPTGQQCPRFRFDALLQPGTEMRLAGQAWQVHAAPGHDPHSVILFEPDTRTLISADALWQNGFGVVFPELEGMDAFDEVGATLDLIAALRPSTVIPGHGAVFTGVEPALEAARRRLDSFLCSPLRHAQHAAKVLIKFKLLEWQRIPRQALANWAGDTRYLGLLHRRYFGDMPLAQWIEQISEDLVRAGVARMEDGELVNA